jgi:diguanylate cyclase (GGDEF)-like protein
MKAAVAARSWWAALRRHSHARAWELAPSAAASQISSYVLIGLALAMSASAIVGLLMTLKEDNRLAAERHAALQLVFDDLQGSAAIQTGHFDDSLLRAVARRTGLNDLRFDSDDTGVAGREVQSLHDAQGRILGWFSWAPDRTLIRALIWLWSILGALGVVLGACAFLAMGLISKLARALAVDLRTIRRLTSEDPLTGLPNHRVMLEKLSTALEKRQSGSVVLALVDIDDFREVNDTHGRAGGDALMKEIGVRLEAALPPRALFGRFEDGDFAVIMESGDGSAAMALAESLRGSLLLPIFMEQNWQVTAGIGIAQAPADGSTAEELNRRADLALRAAKRKGRGTVQAFELFIETDYAEKKFIRRELESAIAAGSLDVHYQPVVAAAGASMIGVEALCRWHHPIRGQIAPSVFIPLAEQSGLMPALGEFVLRRALTEGARWTNLTVAINLSALQIRDPKLLGLIAAIMHESGIAPSRVILEITESVLIEDPEATQQRLEEIRALGVGLALDDFGTGYSSLSYLQKFPFSQIKIDRAFVNSLGTTATAGAVIQSIVTLGHALGMKVLAEGIETDEQRVLLRLAGCDEMQGYLFGRPRPADTIDRAVARLAAGSEASRASRLVR